ncbi:MAG: DUF72 domain-containing protein [Deltaproteobacteria bacterium]
MTEHSLQSRVRFRVGTSGWNYPHWRGVFYPAELPVSRWFEHYCRVFDTVEINNTFYHLPDAETFVHWRAQAPGGFLYAVKANRYLTHLKKLNDVAEPLQRFLKAVRRLGDRRGPILYQLPPRWRRNVERLDDFCRLLPRRMTHVFEFRDADWLVDETFAVLEKHRACLCIHDLVDRHPRVVTGPAVYVRFHGAGELYGGSYSNGHLRRWAEWMREAGRSAQVVYAYFNNDAAAHAIYNALTLREMLA